MGLMRLSAFSSETFQNPDGIAAHPSALSANVRHSSAESIWNKIVAKWYSVSAGNSETWQPCVDFGVVTCNAIQAGVKAVEPAAEPPEPVACAAEIVILARKQS